MAHSGVWRQHQFGARRTNVLILKINAPNRFAPARERRNEKKNGHQMNSWTSDADVIIRPHEPLFVLVFTLWLTDFIFAPAHRYLSRQPLAVCQLSSHYSVECTRTLWPHGSCRMFTWIFYTNYYCLLTRVWLQRHRFFQILEIF